MSERQTLEKSLFDWENWDEVGTTDLQFYNVVLKIPIGEFPIGAKFATAIMSFELSVLQLYEYDSDKFHEFELSLTVGEKIISE